MGSNPAAPTKSSPSIPIQAGLHDRSIARPWTDQIFGRPVIAGLDLSIAPGEFYALLGPNGAGKTTTLRMIAGLMRPDAGSISVFGRDVQADPLGAKAIMAWLPDEPLLYDRLSPMEYLEFVAGLWRVEPGLASCAPRN